VRRNDDQRCVVRRIRNGGLRLFDNVLDPRSRRRRRIGGVRRDLTQQTAVVIDAVLRRGLWLRVAGNCRGERAAVPVSGRDHLQRIARQQQQRPQRDAKVAPPVPWKKPGHAHVIHYIAIYAALNLGAQPAICAQART
jgi:hypothetical protein